MKGSLEFCCNWLKKSPDAARFRREAGGVTAVCYTEKDFIDYLDRYVCEERSEPIRTFGGVFERSGLPEGYKDLPYFGF